MPETDDRLQRYRFGEFVIDERRGALQRDGEDVPLRPKSWGVLRHLVRHPGELVTKRALLEAVWAGRVVTEGVLSKSVGEIRQALGDDAHEIIRTVPRRGYLFEGPVALEAIEDDGRDGESASPELSAAAAAGGAAGPAPDAAQTGTGGSAKRAAAPRGWMASAWYRGAVAAVLLAAVIVFWSMAARDFDSEPPAPEPVLAVPPERSIAVLPFVNLSHDAANEYFSDGIAEEVLNRLAKTPNLGVISRSSSFSFRDEDIDVPSIAARLNVGFVLEGSVRKHGNQVRITAQLIDARSDTHLWSEVYEKELEDVFVVQDEISAAIVESLREAMDLEIDESPVATAAVNAQAHEAYLRGRYLLGQRYVGGAVREFERAVSLDPGYALAHAELAIAYQLGYLDISDTEAAASAAPHVEKALALDPSSAEAHAAAGLSSWTKGEVQEALRHFEKAIEINPSYTDVYTWLANILHVELGRYAEAFAFREKAARLDPLSIVAMFNYTDQLIKRERLTEADRELEKLAVMAPSMYAVLRGLRSSLGGNWADGALGWLEALRIEPDSRRWRRLLADWFAMLGLEVEALAVWEDVDPLVLRLLGKPRQAVVAVRADRGDDPELPENSEEVGLALASAGDYVEARAHLEASWQKHGRVTVAPGFGVDHAAALIAVRRAAGEDDNVADILAAIRDNARRYRESGVATSFGLPGPDYEEGLARYLAGDDEEGLALIARAVERGHFIPPGEAYLRVLYDDPDFADIQAMQEARQALERERFLAVVCADNPYAEVWRPAVGTCERIAEAGVH